MNYGNNKKQIIFGGILIISLSLFSLIEFLPRYFPIKLQIATVYITPATNNFLWVPHYSNPDTNPGTSIQKIDKTTNTVVNTITVGGRPTSVAIDPNFVWIVNTESPYSISKIDKTTDLVVNTIPLGFTATTIAVDSGFIWVAGYSDSLLKIDKITDAIVDTIDVGPAGYTGISGVVVDSDSVWVTLYGVNSAVKKIDKTSSSVVATFPLDWGMKSIAIDNNFVWAVNFDTNYVVKIDKTANTVLDIFYGFNRPSYVVSDNNFLWVTNWGDSTVSKVNRTNNTIMGTIPVGSEPFGMSIDNDFVWVVNSVSNTVSKIDKITNTVVATIAVDNQPIAYGDGTGFIYDIMFSTPASPLPSSPIIRGHKRTVQNTLSEGLGGSTEIEDISVSTSTDSIIEEEPSSEASTTLSTSITPEATSTTNLVEVFTRNLGLGDTGEDVRLLQIYLNSHNFMVSSIGLGSSGNETTFYGEKTKAAVRLYQEYYKDEILTPLGLQEGTGYFGTATRYYLNSNY